ncbi:TPA: glycosyltransferase [Serratia fonticola]|nr:glycosyltransferase [Serratia fonticola]
MNTAKKYLLVIDQIQVGGAERILIDYYQHLISEGHEVKIFVLHYISNESIWIDNISVEYGDKGRGGNPYRHFGYLYVFYNLRKCIKEFNPDIIFSFLEKSNLLSFFAKGDRKTIFTVHNLLSIQYEKIRNGLVKRLLFSALKYAYSKKGSTVVAVSEQVKADLISSFKIWPDNIVVINNRVNADEIKIKATEKIEDYQFSEDKKYIINIGRFTKQKAQSKLIHAFSKLVQENTELDVNLLLMGEGGDERVLRELVSRLELNKRVDFLSFKINPYKYLIKSNLLVLSSDFEGFPIVIAEACSLGVPFIGTDKSIPKEIFSDENEWCNYVVETSNYDEDITKLSSLMYLCLSKSDFTEKLSILTECWDSKNDKKNQFSEYDSLVLK